MTPEEAVADKEIKLPKIFISNHAALVKRLSDAGAKAIAFDVLFDLPNASNPTGDQQFINAARASGRVYVAGKLDPIDYYVFYLFWSRNAMRSKPVENEWRLALKERGREFIDPVPLDSPEDAPPPPELGHKHFNEWVRAFRRQKAPD